MNERAARMTVAVVKFDAEAEPRPTFTVYKAATDQTAGELVLDLMTRRTRPITGAPVNGRNPMHLQ
jgi:hypothetical protein